MAASLLEKPIEYLKGVGPNRGTLLRNELGIDTCKDLLYHFPNRYVCLLYTSDAADEL